MKVRDFTQYDYDTVCRWWEGHSWPAIPECALSDTGFIIDGMCAVWVYSTNSCFSLVEWVIGNPEADKRKLGPALDLLLDHAVEFAKQDGSILIQTTTKHSGLIRRYKNHGFVEGDSGMTILNLVEKT
tara:strand:+ start:3716 stop:4099 length:384 start_codon:yes stop_codon:yes gene_type:complete